MGGCPGLLSPGLSPVKLCRVKTGPVCVCVCVISTSITLESTNKRQQVNDAMSCNPKGIESTTAVQSGIEWGQNPAPVSSQETTWFIPDRITFHIAFPRLVMTKHCELLHDVSAWGDLDLKVGQNSTATGNKITDRKVADDETTIRYFVLFPPGPWRETDGTR